MPILSKKNLNEHTITNHDTKKIDEFSVGDIVAFMSHPYTSKNTEIIISGEHLMIPPLMVVIEVLKNSKDEYNEHTGNPISEKGVSYCKCIWFSDKTNAFEENSFSTKQLKKIALKPDLLVFDSSKPKMAIGKSVALKTLNLELGKKKSVLTLESSYDKNSKTTINSLLSFVSPIMQILEVRKAETKEPIFDKTNGDKKRYISLYEVKCRWYNPVANKYSEKFLPIESLIDIPLVPNDVIEHVQKLIQKKAYLKYELKLIKPESISFRSGYYILKFYDYLSNNTDELNLPDNLDSLKINFVEVNNFYLSQSPNYDSNPFNPEPEIGNLVNKANKDGRKYIRIRYLNRHGKISYRTIENFKLTPSKDIEMKEILLLEGYCLSKKENRTFKVSKIDRIWVLDL